MITVLCIEDERDLREAIVEELRDEGFQTLEADNGREGLEILAQYKPDVVLCDIMMPELSGLEVLESVGETDFDPRMIFIVMSALSDKEHLIAARRLGADDYLTKPIDFDVLVATIRSRIASNARIVNAVNLENPSGTELSAPANAELSGFDSVTGFANQRSLHLYFSDRKLDCYETLSHWMMVVDIANLTDINSRYGYGVGTDIVRHVGRQIKKSLGNMLPGTMNGDRGFLVARLPRGNFGILLIGDETRDGIECVAKELIHAITVRMPDTVPEDVSLRVRMGAFGAQSADITATIRGAEKALREAKQSGEAIAISDQFSPVNDCFDASFQLVNEIPRALRLGELELYYQPRVNFVREQVDSVEALVRWHHPQAGLVLPDRFIPLSEQTGLIFDIGDWVLVEACKQAKTWLNGGILDLRVAVNISPVHFAQKRFVGRVAEILREIQLAPDRLEIEITESTFLISDEAARSNVAALRSLGVSVAIDDFGTGFANFSYMKNLDTNTVKLDRAFVGNIVNDQFDTAVAKAILKLGELQEMKVVAEGVETLDQANFLRELGCTEFQGFLYSPPVAANKIPMIVQDLSTYLNLKESA